MSAFALTTVNAADISVASKHIDVLVAKGLAKEKLKPNKTVGDETFHFIEPVDINATIGYALGLPLVQLFS